MTTLVLAFSLLMMTGCGDDEESTGSDMAMDAGVDAMGGAASGGAMTGGAAMGGASMGGASMGGATTGGAATGGAATGGSAMGGAMTNAIEVVGTWDSNFGGQEVITDTMWTSFTSFTIISWDNDANTAVLLQADDGGDFANTYSAYAWTEIANNSFFYCTTAFGAASAEEAEMMAFVPDDSAPDMGGCNGFPWTQLTLAMP